MSKIGDSKKGFAVVEVILLLVIVSIIGFAGWFVWHSKQATDEALTPANSSVSSSKEKKEASQSTATAKNTIKFTELGVQFTVADSIKDLEYKVFAYSDSDAVLQDDSGKPLASTQANMSTASLLAANPSCTPTSSPLGIFYKVAGTYPDNPKDTNSGGKLVKQFDGYYIGYSSSSAGGCDGALQQQAVRDAFSTIQETK